MVNKNISPLLKFKKMHGLGNDFIIFDGREQNIDLSENDVRLLANRQTGIGCNQLIIIQKSDKAEGFLHIQNSDGSLAESCGNATRCVASLIMSQTGKKSAEIDSLNGLLHCERNLGEVTVDMGEPRFGWLDIPLSEARNTLNLGLTVGALKNPVALNVGNPHVVFFVENAEEIDVATLGPIIEKYPLFPERVNVNVAQILNEDTIRLRVWERGAGITRACGTGACATLVAANKRGFTNKVGKIILDGGNIKVEWTKGNRIIMTGDTALSFEGEVDLNAIINKAKS